MSIIKQMALEAIRNNGGEPLDEAGAEILLRECIQYIGNEVNKYVAKNPHEFGAFQLRIILDSMNE